MAERKELRAPSSGFRFTNVVLGSWLFITAFLWPHSSLQLTNSWLVGAAVVLVSLIALAAPFVRYLNAALAVWLLLSVWVLPTSTGTAWNNALVAIAVFAFAMIPGVPERRFQRRAHA